MALRSFADGAVFAETFGEGPPRVLALHGWGRRGADFKSALAGLPALAPDLPGFGASPPPSRVLGAEGYADVVAELLDEFDELPVIVGHSFGGRVAVCVGAKHPKEVSSMILTGVPLLRQAGPRKPALSYRIIRSLNKAGIVSDERMEAERQKRGSADYRSAVGVMRDILVKVVNEEYPDQLTALDSRVHLLWGRNDEEVPLVVAERAAGLLGDRAHLQVLDGVGHHVPLEAPDELRRVIDSVLE